MRGARQRGALPEGFPRARRAGGRRRPRPSAARRRTPPPAVKPGAAARERRTVGWSFASGPMEGRRLSGRGGAAGGASEDGSGVDPSRRGKRSETPQGGSRSPRKDRLGRRARRARAARCGLGAALRETAGCGARRPSAARARRPAARRRPKRAEADPRSGAAGAAEGDCGAGTRSVERDGARGPRWVLPFAFLLFAASRPGLRNRSADLGPRGAERRLRRRGLGATVRARAACLRGCLRQRRWQEHLLLLLQYPQ